jgi:hypothetical protein
MAKLTGKWIQKAQSKHRKTVFLSPGEIQEKLRQYLKKSVNVIILTLCRHFPANAIVNK